MTFNFEAIFIVKKDTLFYFELEIHIEIILTNLCNDHNVVFKIIDVLFLEVSIKQIVVLGRLTFYRYITLLKMLLICTVSLVLQ